LRQRQDAISQLVAAHTQRDGLHRLLQGCVDIERINGRIALTSARPRDLSGLRDTLTLLPQLSAQLSGLDSPLLQTLRHACAAQPDTHDVLQRALRPEPASVIREGGVIADGFDAELDELRSLQHHSGEFLLALEARERERSGIANLRVEYNRVHGFYIEVSRAQADNVPADYRRARR
jgi:DNA mismatch repair protein MutS